MWKGVLDGEDDAFREGLLNIALKTAEEFA
jgi:hypothetical protein